MSMKPRNYLFDYYRTVKPNERVLELCGANEPETPYTSAQDDDLTVIINAYARPAYLPLIWEAIQYQSHRPKHTWIVQNCPTGRSCVPRSFFDEVRDQDGTLVIDSGLNHGCWFRFFLAALSCRTRYVAIYDDDTLSGRHALETALNELYTQPGIYGGRGITLNAEPQGPRFWNYDVSGWPVGNEMPQQVDFVGHLWIMETYWLKEIFKYVPDRLLTASVPAKECGEDMYLSYVAQKLGIATYTYSHGHGCNPKWSSIQAYEMGMDAMAMHRNGELSGGDAYLQEFLRDGWRLLRYTAETGAHL